MNILNVNMSIDPVTGGGTAERTLQISRALNRAGHQCTVLTTDKELSPAYLYQCIKWGLNDDDLQTSGTEKYRYGNVKKNGVHS